MPKASYFLSTVTEKNCGKKNEVKFMFPKL